MRPSPRRARFLALLVVGALALAACGGDDDTSSSDEASNDTTDRADDGGGSGSTSRSGSGDDYGYGDTGGGSSGGGASAAPGEVKISGFAFSPSPVKVAAGPATFAVSNADSVAHTFTVRNLDVDIEVPAGATRTAQATVPASGTFDVICRIHPQMRGTVTVG